MEILLGVLIDWPHAKLQRQGLVMLAVIALLFGTEWWIAWMEWTALAR